MVWARMHLQAAIAAYHARALTCRTTPTGSGIAALYDALAQIAPSPVVELNRAVAVSMAFGPAAGLELVDALVAEPQLKNYHLLPSVRGRSACQTRPRPATQVREFQRAAALTRNTRERELLLDRAAACAAVEPRASGVGLASSQRDQIEHDAAGERRKYRGAKSDRHAVFRCRGVDAELVSGQHRR